MNETAEQTNEVKTMDDIEKQYYPASAIEKANTAMTEAFNIAGADNVTMNFDPEQDFPEGYGVAIVPITERVPEKGNKAKGVLFAAIPELATVLEDKSGDAWIQKIALDKMVSQVMSSAKSIDETSVSTLPFSITDFTTSSRGSGNAAFNALASDYVAEIKKKGLRILTKPIFKNVLASKAFAEELFPSVGQESWTHVLDVMIEHAQKEGLDPIGLLHWKNTRDNVEVQNADVDLSGLEMLGGGDDSEE